MSRIIPVKMNMEPILEDRELRYAVKHQGDGLHLEGIWQCDQFRNGKLVSGGYPEPPNIFPIVGIGRMLTVYFHDIEKDAAEIFYVGIFKGNIAPLAADTSAKLGNGNAYLECQDADYDLPLTNKPAYTTEDTVIATITNAVGGKAEFTMAASITVYGAFLNTVAAKTGNSGYLTAAKRFTNSRAVIDDDVLSITYEISVTST